MLFKVVERARWDGNEWEQAFNLINDFRNEFNIPVKTIGSSVSGNTIYFSMSGFNIYFKENNQGMWVTLEADTNKSNFDEKYEFVFSRLS